MTGEQVSQNASITASFLEDVFVIVSCCDRRRLVLRSGGLVGLLKDARAASHRVISALIGWTESLGKNAFGLR